jgi:methionyl-tRNA formyltransferase
MGGAPPVILLAADQVGLQVTEFLARRQEPIDWLVLDAADRGGCNAEIRRALAGAGGTRRVEPAESLSDPAFLRELTAAKPRLGVLAWWPHILKGPLVSIPTLGWLNLHPGYIPYNRGKHPNFWCLVDGTPCGAALHFVDPGVDTGPVIARAQIETRWEDTGETVHRKCRDLAVQLFKDNFDAVIRGTARRAPQVMGEGTAHRSTEIETVSEIDLDQTYTARHLINLMRARMFPPHPTAFFNDGGKTYSVKVVIEERDRGAA